MEGLGVVLSPEEIKELPLEFQGRAEEERKRWEIEENLKERREILADCQNRKWSDALRKAIEYQGDIDEGLEIAVKVAVSLSFFRMRKNGYYEGSELNEIAEALLKIGEGLANSPWKEKFTELAGCVLPYSCQELEGIVAVVKRTGIYYEIEYKLLVQEAVEREERGKGKSLRTLGFREFSGMPINEGFLAVGDIYLKTGQIDDACQIYQKLPSGTIGEARKEIIAGFNAKKRNWRKIYRIAEKELGIKIPKGDC